MKKQGQLGVQVKDDVNEDRKKWLDYRIYLGIMIIKICQSTWCWVTEKSSWGYNPWRIVVKITHSLKFLKNGYNLIST